MSKGLAKSASDRNASWLAFKYRVAHHPTCDNFSQHFYHIFNEKLCRGCVMMYSGYIVGLIILPTVIINGLIDLGGLNVMMYALLLPTVLSAYLGPPRPIRDVARLMLGISMMTFYAIIIVSIIDKAWWVAVLTLVVYFSLKRILMNKRENSNDEVCQTCPEVNKPRCSGMKEYHDRQMIIDGTVSRFDVFSE